MGCVPSSLRSGDKPIAAAWYSTTCSCRDLTLVRVFPQPTFPAAVPKVAHSLISKLLEKDLSKRFGNLRKGGEDVKAHRFFEGTDWAQVEARKFAAGSALKPKLSGDADRSRFAASTGHDAGPPPIDDTLVIPRNQQELFKSW